MSFVQDLYVNNTLNVTGISTLLNDLNIQGNLDVQGTMTSIDTVSMNVKDRHVLLNNGYTSDAALTGGIVVNYDPTTTNDTGAGVGFASTSTLGTTGASTFSGGDIIQISGASDVENNGIYQVLTHTGNLLTIATTSDFCQDSFVADSTTSAVIYKVNVSIIQTNTSGLWQTTRGDNTTDITANTKDILLSGDSVTVETLSLSANADQLLFTHSEAGGLYDNTTTIDVIDPAANIKYTIPDVGVDADFVMTGGSQTIVGTKTFDPNSASGGAMVVSNTTTQTSGNLVSITGDTGQTALNIIAGNVICGENFLVSGTATLGNVVDEVKAYTGAGAHLLGVTGRRVNEITHTGAATVTLPTAPTQGTKYTIINFLDADNDLTINVGGGSDTIDNGALTSIKLKKKYQRLTLQYVGLNWYIV